MIGYGNNERWFGAMYLLPARKKPCLVIKKGATITKVASFNNEEAVKEFFDFVSSMFYLDKIDWEQKESVI